MSKEDMKILTVYLTKHSLEFIKEAIDGGWSPSRSEYIRQAVHNQIRRDVEFFEQFKTRAIPKAVDVKKYYKTLADGSIETIEVPE